jgi:tetratricopeptide (TPR) repeat protein
MAAFPRVSPGAGYHLPSAANVAAQRGVASLASSYRLGQYGGNRGWNGPYYHHPWGYLPFAYLIYPYTYGPVLGGGYYGYGYGAPVYNYNVYDEYAPAHDVYNDYQDASGPPAAPYSDSYPPAVEGGPEAAPPPPAAGGEDPFYAQAAAAFSAGDYEKAIRLANHALVDAPKDARTHQLLSLAMFAQGDYRGAAIEAHPAISLGPIGNWAGIQALYNSPDTYSTQLRALESYVVSHPKAADAHFLLGYQYLILGHADAAKYQFQAARRLTPDDALAATLAGS